MTSLFINSRAAVCVASALRWLALNRLSDNVGGVKNVRGLHQTFLKGTTDTIENMDIRFATEDVAVATVTSVASPFTSPDGVKHGVEPHIRTFVVVNRGGRWLIMQDHNTTVIALPAR